MSGYDQYIEHGARLVILKEMAKWPDGRLNEADLTVVLDAFAYRRSREWVRTQLNKLAELGAVTTVQQGSVLVATITRVGLDHVERRSVIEGVARPSPEA